MTNRNGLAAAAAIVVIASAIALACLLRGDDTAPPAQRIDAPNSDTTQPASADTIERAGSTTRTDRTDAATAEPSTRPIPADAPWTTIRAIDRATKAPIAGAAVHWVDDTSNADLERARGLRAADETILRANTRAYAERFGWSTTTDGDGKARVTRNGWLTVAAEKGGVHGEVYLEPSLLAPHDGFVVELVPDRRIVVQVVDDRGDPAPDVVVGLYAGRVGRRANGPGQWAVKARTRAPDGIAILEHVQDFGPNDENGDEPSGNWRVFAMPLAPGDYGTEVSLADPPREPVVLRLPTCGSVVVTTHASDIPPHTLGSASLSDNATSIAVGPGSLRADGSVLFPRVPIGREYLAQSGTKAIRDKVLAGPTARDQQVTVHLDPATDKILLAARLLDTDGQPLGPASIGMLVQGTGLEGNAWLHTDTDGRALATWEKLGEHDRIQRIAFFRTEPIAGHGEIEPVDLHLGFNDLGDVRLTRDRVVCAGRFVDAGEPVDRDVAFQVEHLAPETAPQQGAEWLEATTLSIHRERRGRFLVLGTPPTGDLRLAFEPSEQLPHDPVPFRAGTTDLEIVIETPHSLAASVLVPKDAPEWPVVAELIPQNAAAFAAPSANDEQARMERRRRYTNADGRSERRNLHWDTVRRGTYTLEVRSWFEDEATVRIPNVVVPPAGTGDRRLEDIDLRSALRVLLVRVLFADGEPDPSAYGTVFAAGQSAGAPWRGFHFEKPEFRLLVPKRPLSLLFVDHELPPRAFRVDGDRLDVQLPPWPTVRIVIADMPPLPADLSVIARLSPVDRREIAVHDQWDTDGTIALDDLPSAFVRAVAGHVELPIGEGPHELSLGLRHASGRIEFGLLEQETRITANATPPVIRISAERWEAAIRSIEEAAANDAGKR
ncbi:MAG: hypothetical protein JNK78_01865 [Planctomycetes bacterium]|nr:hypothetical protein [Planctomycetota bacterium]